MRAGVKRFKHELINFREQIADDAEEIFFRLDEFAQEINLNGERLVGIKLNNFHARRYDFNSGENFAAQGVGDCDLILYLRAGDLRLDNEGLDAQINVDGREFFVKSLKNIAGVFLRVELEAVIGE